jgi:hypothetical protein
MLKHSQIKAIKAKGHGYFIQYNKTTKKGVLGEKRTTRSFNSEQDAINHAHKLQDGKSVVNVIDGTNLINHKKIGSINLSGKFSEGV